MAQRSLKGFLDTASCLAALLLLALPPLAQGAKRQGIARPAAPQAAARPAAARQNAARHDSAPQSKGRKRAAGKAKPQKQASRKQAVKKQTAKKQAAKALRGAKLREKILLPLGDESITLTEKNQLQGMLRSQLAPPSLLMEILSPDSTKEQSLIKYLAAEKLISMALSEESAPGLDEKAIAAEASKALPGMMQRIKKRCCKSQSGRFKRKLRQNGLALSDLEEQARLSLQRDLFIRRRFMERAIVSHHALQARLSPEERKALLFEYEFASVSFERDDQGIQAGRRFQKRARRQGFQEEGFRREAKRAGLPLKKRRLKGGEMSPALEGALKRMSVLEISPLIPIGKEIYVFQLLWKSALFPPLMEKRRRQLHALLLKEAANRNFLQWLNEQKTGYTLPSL